MRSCSVHAGIWGRVDKICNFVAILSLTNAIFHAEFTNSTNTPPAFERPEQGHWLTNECSNQTIADQYILKTHILFALNVLKADYASRDN